MTYRYAIVLGCDANGCGAEYVAVGEWSLNVTEGRQLAARDGWSHQPRRAAPTLCPTHTREVKP